MHCAGHADDDERGEDDVGDEEGHDEVEPGEAFVVGSPALGEDGVGVEERHVDAYGGADGAEDGGK